MRSLATFTWNELLQVTNGEAVSHHRPFDRASLDTDTRTLGAGAFFLPLKGENFNGNEFIDKAYEMGAEGAFIEKAFLETHPDLKRFPNLIAVPDPLIAYLELARFHRERSDARVVAITGSSGKTTTKEMLYALLYAALGEGVQKSEKNFNNEIGVSQTLLNLKPETQVLIVEMGMRGLNQINILSRHAKPNIAMVTNVGPAHIGLLGSLENIAKAKCEIFTGLDRETGLGIVNGDDPILVEEANRSWEGRIEAFSLHEVDEVHTKGEEGIITFNYEDVTFTLGLPGCHNVMNALAAIKVCEHLGVPLKRIANALANFEPGGGRWNKSMVEGSTNLWVINDAYNANPASMKVALGAFMDLRSEGLLKVAIVGGMAELGKFSEQYHREVGEWINSRAGLDGLIVVGEEARPLADAILPNTIPTFAVEKNSDAIPLIQQHWPKNAIFLLKASRAYHLEEIPEQLKAATHAVSS